VKIKTEVGRITITDLPDWAQSFPADPEPLVLSATAGSVLRRITGAEHEFVKLMAAHLRTMLIPAAKPKGRS